jgi:hypothetical protein
MVATKQSVVTGLTIICNSSFTPTVLFELDAATLKMHKSVVNAQAEAAIVINGPGVQISHVKVVDAPVFFATGSVDGTSIVSIDTNVIVGGIASNTDGSISVECDRWVEIMAQTLSDSVTSSTCSIININAFFNTVPIEAGDKQQVAWQDLSLAIWVVDTTYLKILFYTGIALSLQLIINIQKVRYTYKYYKQIKQPEL